MFISANGPIMPLKCVFCSLYISVTVFVFIIYIYLTRRGMNMMSTDESSYSTEATVALVRAQEPPAPGPEVLSTIANDFRSKNRNASGKKRKRALK